MSEAVSALVFSGYIFQVGIACGNKVFPRLFSVCRYLDDTASSEVAHAATTVYKGGSKTFGNVKKRDCRIFEETCCFH